MGTTGVIEDLASRFKKLDGEEVSVEEDLDLR